MEEVKKFISVKNARYPESLCIGEKANFQRKVTVCICECPDTLKHMVACDGCHHALHGSMTTLLHVSTCTQHRVIGSNCEEHEYSYMTLVYILKDNS